MQAVGCGPNPHYEGCFDGETEELAELRRTLAKDAERYRAIKRWHRAYCVGGEPGGMNVHILTMTRLGRLDSAIDAAMAKTPNHKISGPPRGSAGSAS